MTKTNYTESYFIRTVYGLQPYYITVINKDGKEMTVDVYGTAYQVVTKTLKRAVTNRAIELYDGRVSTSVHQITDLLQTASTALLLGYTDKKGVYHKGYITDSVNDYTTLIGTAYTAVNAYLYAKGVIGDNLGKEILTEDYSIVHNVTNLFGYVATATSINKAKYDSYIDRVAKTLQRTSDIDILHCIAYDVDYVTAKGEICYTKLADKFDVSTSTIKRAVRRIKTAMLDTVSSYNMTVVTFLQYLQTA